MKPRRSKRTVARAPAERPFTGAMIIRFGLAGAFALAIIFIGSWTVAQLPYGPTDLIVQLFTSAAPATTEALFEGVLVAALLGFFGASLLALAYAAFSFIEELSGTPRREVPTRGAKP